MDGCIGALIAIAPKNQHLVAGIEEADSIALDPHKWLHVPFEAGCAIVRDAEAHRGAFAMHSEYLEEKPRGIAAAGYLHEYNLQTSRGFRALKIWLMLKEHGVAKFGRLIDQNISQGEYLRGLVENEPDLTLIAPSRINIVCFQYTPRPMSEEQQCALNTEIMLRLQEDGIAAMSDTTIAGKHCLRVAICNHRTTCKDLDLLVRETLRVGADVISESATTT